MGAQRAQRQGRSIFTARTLRQGAGPLLLLVALCLAGTVWAWWLGVILLIPLAFTVAFFRDPARSIPDLPGAILAPADGTVVAIERVSEEQFLHGEAVRIAIFLSIFDVHVQRMPIAGGLKLVRYHPGGHLDARDRRATSINESRLLGIESEDGFRVVVRQIAGRIARRIVGWADTGEALGLGDRLGMIRFGSRVELFLPVNTTVLVSVNQHVTGGETILAQRR